MKSVRSTNKAPILMANPGQVSAYSAFTAANQASGAAQCGGSPFMRQALAICHLLALLLPLEIIMHSTRAQKPCNIIPQRCPPKITEIHLDAGRCQRPSYIWPAVLATTAVPTAPRTPIQPGKLEKITYARRHAAPLGRPW